MVALVDCNNFYASCERVFRPDLKDKPIVVLSNNDGCIISRSKEAKHLNIKMGEPYFKIRHQLEKQGVVVFSSNYALYGDMSARIIEYLEHYSNQVEVYSIDEAFMLLSEYNTDVLGLAKNIRKGILQQIGIPVKIGLAKTKTLAKIASKYAKQNEHGVYRIDHTNHFNLLKKVPIHDVWGIGLGWSKYLVSAKIDTAYAFISQTESFVKKHLGVIGLRIYYELKGCYTLPVKQDNKQRKNIMTSRSFGQPVQQYSQLREAVSSYTVRCAQKLRNEQLNTSSITVFLKAYGFQKHDPQYKVHNRVHLPTPTNDSIVLIEAANQLLAKSYNKGLKYKKAGVLFSDLTPTKNIQLDLFHKNDLGFSSKRNQLMTTMDELTLKFGKGSVFCASEGIHQAWKMKSEFKSPNYTTQWNEINDI